MQPSRQLPAGGEPNPRRMADAINAALQGRLECVSSVTLTAGATSTVVSDPRAHADAVILLSPLTANAAGALATTYISSRGQKTFTVTHANNGQTDKTFSYAVLG